MFTNFKRKGCLALILVLVVIMTSFQMTGSTKEDKNDSLYKAASCQMTSFAKNVALGKATTCSGFTEGHEASRANDNDVSTYWESTSSSMWWEVDLGAFYDISKINIVNEVNHQKKKHDQNNTTGNFEYTIFSSPNDKDWTKVVSKQNNEEAEGSGGINNKDWIKAVNKHQKEKDNGSGETYSVSTNWIRYLKVEITSNTENSSTQIRDFKAYGVPSSSKGLGIGQAGLNETSVNFPVTKGVTRTLITRGYNSGASIASSTTGPWQVNVLTVDPRSYKGKIQARLCGGYVSTTETVQNEAYSQGATAAVNGSFFTVSPFNGTIGGSMGLFAMNGQITNESINPRGAILIPNGKVNDIMMGRFTSKQYAVASDGSSIAINGINRMPGVKVGVGPNYVALHDTETQFTDEIILYTDMFGKATEKRLSGYTMETVTGPWGTMERKVAQYDNIGAEAIIRADGVVTEIFNTVGDHNIPRGGKVLAGIGNSAAWITEHLQVGKKLKTDISLTCNGKPVKLGPKASIISAGPMLMQKGIATTEAQWAEEGFVNATWNARNPRTLVGKKADGTLLIVVVDGRDEKIGVGASLVECQSIMKSLGATEVLNLDGGRSSIMTLGNTIVNNMLENRKVGDILELLPK